MQNRTQSSTVSNGGKGWYKVIALVAALVVVVSILRALYSGPDTVGEITNAPVPVPAETVLEQPVIATKKTNTINPADVQLSAAVLPSGLMLRGVFASPQRKLSLAIIANDEAVERYFMLDDRVFDAAILKEIHQYHVVILRNGQRKILRLSRDTDEWEEEPSLEAKRGRLLADYRKAILSGDIEKFVGVAGYRPAYKGTDLYGFEIISQGKKGDAFLSQTGLQHGDVVTSINGHELATDLEYMRYLANNIKTLSEMNIGVERAGTILFFTYITDSPTAQTQPLQTQSAGEPAAPPILEDLLKDENPHRSP